MAKTTTAAEDAGTEIRINEQKWGKPLMAAGWTILPNMVFAHQAELELGPTDINVLLHLLSYWWSAGDLPHPSKKTIAEMMGIDPRTVQRRIAAMEKRGLIQRVRRQGAHRGTQTNIYKFDGLIEAATVFAKKHVEEREAKAKAKAGKTSKGSKPKLSIVKE